MYITSMRNKKYRNRDWLYAEYWDNERSAPNMAGECGVTKRVIHYWMEKHGIPLRTVSEAKCGRLHPLYGKKLLAATKKKMSDSRRGDGRLVLKNGTIRHWIPGHPNADCGGYVFEHRLIMEHEIGRYLEPQEVVHHKDRDGSNNNPKNLRLYATNGKHCSFHCDERRYAKYVTSV